MTGRAARLLDCDRAALVTMERALSAYADSDFVNAAHLSFDLLAQQPSYLPALVCFARSIQLADENATRDFTLDDVRKALEKASELYAITVDPAHELSWFLFAVDDNDEAALEVVERAIVARTAQLRDLLVTKVEILRDMGRDSEADDVARDALRMFPSDADLKATLG